MKFFSCPQKYDFTVVVIESKIRDVFDMLLRQEQQQHVFNLI